MTARTEDQTDEAVAAMVAQGLRDRDESVALAEGAHSFESVETFMTWLDEGEA